MTKREVMEAKRAAVAARLFEIQGNLNTLSRMWDERTLDTLILALGIGHVELEENHD